MLVNEPAKVMPKKIYQSLTLPTGDVTSPVCVGDLPTFDYKVAVSTPTETVTRQLEANPDLPGVILLDNEQLAGVIPRIRMFERLGHRFGLELFLRKPIIELRKNLATETYVISDHTSIKDAVHFALSRPSHSIYEPLIIAFDDHELRLLDVYTLLVAQSQNLDNLNNLMGSMNHIKLALSSGLGLEKTLDAIMGTLKKVVPYHHAAILLKEPNGLHLSARYVTVYTPSQPIIQNAIYQSILDTSKPVYLEDVKMVPAWSNLSSIGDLRTWMGLPVQHNHRPLGVLSIARRSLSPFNKNEMDTAQAFTEHIGAALNNSNES